MINCRKVAFALSRSFSAGVLRRAQRKRLRQFERNQPSLFSFLEHEHLDQNGRAVISIDCTHVTEFFQPLSFGAQLALSPSILEYIDLKAYPIPTVYPIVIRFLNWRGDGAQERLIRSRLLKHYLLALRDREDDLRLNLIKSLSLLVFGASMLMLSFGLTRYLSDPFITEFLSIVSTFSLWEAVDLFLLERRRLNDERLNSGQLAMAAVAFEKKP